MGDGDSGSVQGVIADSGSEASGMMVVRALFPSDVAAICHSAVEEQPIKPILPLVHGCAAIHVNWSSASVSGAPRMS